MNDQKQQAQIYYFIIFLILGSSLLLAGCASAGRTKLQALTLAPLSEMPDYVQEAAPEVQEAYQFAVANPEALEHIPFPVRKSTNNLPPRSDL